SRIRRRDESRGTAQGIRERKESLVNVDRAGDPAKQFPADLRPARRLDGSPGKKKRRVTPQELSSHQIRGEALFFAGRALYCSHPRRSRQKYVVQVRPDNFN